MLNRLSVLLVALFLFCVILSSPSFGQDSSTFYGIRSPNVLIQINPTNLAETVIGPINIPNVYGLALDPASEVLYGITQDGNLISVDKVTGQGIVIQTLPSDGTRLFTSLAIDASENPRKLYAANGGSGREVYRISLDGNPPYGVTRIGSATLQITGLAFHPSTAVLYAINRSQNALGILNKATGAFISTFPNAGINNPENIAFGPNETLYGVFSPSVLATYDLSNGQASSFGATTSQSALASLVVIPTPTPTATPTEIPSNTPTPIDTSTPTPAATSGLGSEVVNFGDEPNVFAANILKTLRSARPQARIKRKTASGTSVLYRWKIRDKSASIISVHFKRFSLAAGDYVIVRSPDNRRFWKYTKNGEHEAGLTKEGFWSIPVVGNTAIVELFQADRSKRYGFEIDRYSKVYKLSNSTTTTPTPSPTIVGICGPDDLKNAACYKTTEPAAYSRGETVVRILNGNTNKTCTGFFFGSQGDILTVAHCFSSANDYSSTSVEAMAEGSSCTSACNSQGACSGTILSSSVNLIHSNPNLDYALIRPNVTTNFSNTYGYLQARVGYTSSGEKLYIPQHPNYWGKQFAFASSQPDSTSGLTDIVSAGYPDGYAITTCYTNPPIISLIHRGDTSAGSSGAPILSRTDHLVVAMHYCSGCPGDDNFGIKIEEITTDLTNSNIAPSCIFSTGKNCPTDGMPTPTPIATPSPLPTIPGNGNGTFTECQSCANTFDCAMPFTCWNNVCIEANFSKKLGDRCCSGQQCSSANCGPEGVCQCSTNADCPGGKQCVSYISGNVCQSPKLKDCQECILNLQCSSGDCIGGLCGKKHSLPANAECCRDKQCISESCKGGVCQECKRDSQCGEGYFCNIGAFYNFCEEKRKPCEKCSLDKQCYNGYICKGKPFGKCVTGSENYLIGDDCCRNVQCATGNCNVSGKCQCDTNGHCPAGEYCDKGTLGIGANQCKSYIGECDICILDSQCAPGSTCKNFYCITPNSRSMGQSCCRNDQCTTGDCNIDHVCQCKNDSDCGSGAYCEKGFLGIGKNSCRPAIGECDLCIRDSQCGYGGECIGFVCIHRGSRSKGQSCCRDAQCASGNCKLVPRECK